MNWSLKRTTAPAIEPVTLTEVKEQTHITHTAQDSTLTAYIVAGRMFAEEYTRQSFISQVWTIGLDEVPTEDIKLMRGPIQTVNSIIYTDENGTATTMSLTDFDIDTTGIPGRISLADGKSWPSTTPRRYNAVQIQYKAGYGDAAASVPAPVKHAIKLFASFADDNRAAEIDGVPKVFWDLLKPYRMHTYEPR